MRRIIYKIHDGKSVYSANINDIDIYFGGLLSVAIAEIPKTVFLNSDFHNHMSVDITAEEVEFGINTMRNISVKLHNSKVNMSRVIVFNTDVIREKYYDSEKFFIEDWRNKFRDFEHDCKVQLYVGASAISPSPSKEMMNIGAYFADDVRSCMEIYSCIEADSRRKNFMKFDIDKAIFSDPATIVYWADGTKTVVKAQNGEPYDPEKGLAMCFAKKARGNKGNYYDEFRKHLPEPEEPKSLGDALVEACNNWKKSLEALNEALKSLDPYRLCRTCAFEGVDEHDEPCGSCDLIDHQPDLSMMQDQDGNDIEEDSNESTNS